MTPSNEERSLRSLFHRLCCWLVWEARTRVNRYSRNGKDSGLTSFCRAAFSFGQPRLLSNKKRVRGSSTCFMYASCGKVNSTVVPDQIKQLPGGWSSRHLATCCTSRSCHANNREREARALSLGRILGRKMSSFISLSWNVCGTGHTLERSCSTTSTCEVTVIL